LSGSPVAIANQTAKTAIYYTPYLGNQVVFPNGTILSFAEISTDVPATTVTPFDIFAYSNNGTLTLTTLNWTSDTARATALAYSNGLLVKSGDSTRLYLGTGRTTTVSGQTEDSLLRRFLWNYYNRVNRLMFEVDAAASWTYTTATYRQSNANTGNKIEAVIGVSEDGILVQFQQAILAGGLITSSVNTGIGADSITVPSGQQSYVTGTMLAGALATLETVPTIGYHYYAALETSDGSSSTFYAGAGNNRFQLTAILRG
jgi:hypothetical protein